MGSNPISGTTLVFIILLDIEDLMHLIKVFFLLLLSINLFANNQLKSNYLIQNNYIMLSDIIKNPKTDKKLYDINKERHSKRIKAKELLKRLNSLGYKNVISKHTYIQFSQRSPINTKKIELYISEHYKKHYINIKIETIEVNPRSYLHTIPDQYRMVINEKAYLNKNGIVYLKTVDNKKIFFNYLVRAKVSVIFSKNEIKRGSELSNLNTKKESVTLDRFRAKPLEKLEKSTLQAKIKIKADSVLTLRDVSGLNLIHRGSNVHVSIIDQNMAVSFMAKAHQNGKYGETITVINRSGKKVKVLVTGKNRAEIR